MLPFLEYMTSRHTTWRHRFKDNNTMHLPKSSHTRSNVTDITKIVTLTTNESRVYYHNKMRTYMSLHESTYKIA